MLALRSSRTLTPTGERPALMWLVFLLLSGMLIACEGKTEKSAQTAVVHKTQHPADGAPESAFDYCDRSQYPAARFHEADLTMVLELLTKKHVLGWGGPKAWRLYGVREEDIASSFIPRKGRPFTEVQLGVYPFAFHRKTAAYCAFTMLVQFDQYRALELVTVTPDGHFIERLAVTGKELTGLVYDSLDGEQFATGNPEWRCRFLNDTLIEIITSEHNWDVGPGDSLQNERIDTTVTRYSLLPTGNFREIRLPGHPPPVGERILR